MFNHLVDQGCVFNRRVRRNLRTVEIGADPSFQLIFQRKSVRSIRRTTNRRNVRAEASRRLIAAVARLSLTITWMIMRPL